jgi:predicted NBD/HSP70 family sugar kinase
LSQIQEVRKAKRLCPQDIRGIGIGLPGQVHEDCGWLIFAPGLKQRNVDVVARLTSRMPGSNIFVDNDVNCATLAEHKFGRGRKFRNFICVFVGTDVGAGIVIEGHLHRGKNSAAGEIGHMRIDMAEDALLCKCGRRGCLEEYASARAITRMAGERINGLNASNDVTPEKFITCFKQGDSNAISIATEFARNLSIGLDFDFFRNALKIGFENNVLSITKDTPILEATYGNKSGMIGAAALAEIKVTDRG